MPSLISSNGTVNVNCRDRKQASSNDKLPSHLETRTLVIGFRATRKMFRKTIP